MSNIVIAQASKLAKSLGMEGEGQDLISTLKATAFKGQVSDAQMAALLLVANQYGLSPWTKEIYAFPDKNNGIVPVVGVDGWSRIMNEHPQFDGMEFEQTDEQCTCRIYRKDRSRPIVVTEYMAECKRANVGPWQSHPRRMLRHKAMIQCARLAFGFGGIYDQDEAERIAEIDITAQGSHTTAPATKQPPPPYPADDFAKNVEVWDTAVKNGRITPDQVIARASSKYTLSAEQVAAIHALGKQEAPPEQPANIDEDGVIDAEFIAAYDSQ